MYEFCRIIYKSYKKSFDIWFESWIWFCSKIKHNYVMRISWDYVYLLKKLTCLDYDQISWPWNKTSFKYIGFISFATSSSHQCGCLKYPEWDNTEGLLIPMALIFLLWWKFE